MKGREESVKNRIWLAESAKELPELEPRQQMRFAAKIITKALKEAGYYKNKKSR